jgi:hypothetical protein
MRCVNPLISRSGSPWWYCKLFGYGKNNEVQLSVWWPCELEEGEAGLEMLDIEAVLPHSLYYKLETIFYKLAPLRKKFRRFA